MATVKSDSSSKSFLSFLMGYPLLIGLLLYYLNKKYGKTIKNWFVYCFIVQEMYST